MTTDEMLEDWTIKQNPGGYIVVQHEDGSGVAVTDGDNDSIAAAILYRLARDLLERSAS